MSRPKKEANETISESDSVDEEEINTDYCSYFQTCDFNNKMFNQQNETNIDFSIFHSNSELSEEGDILRNDDQSIFKIALIGQISIFI